MRDKKVLFFIFYFLFFVSHFSYAGGLKTAQELFLRSDYDGVIKECRQELSSSSRSKPEIRYLLALAYLKKNELGQAEDNFIKLISECKALPLCNKAFLGLGDVYFLKEDYAKALDFYLQANESPGELEAQVYYRLARVNLKLGNIEKAKEYLSLLTKNYPLSFEAQEAASLNMSDVFFTVQVGAFSSKKNASKLISALKEKGFDAYIEPQGAADNILYRVRVGKFKSKEEAEQAAQNLSEQGYPSKIFP